MEGWSFLLTRGFFSGGAGVFGFSGVVIPSSSVTGGVERFLEILPWSSALDCAAAGFFPLKTGRGATRTGVDTGASSVVLSFFEGAAIDLLSSLSS